LDSDLATAALLLALGIIAFVLIVASEAGVIAGVRARALREPAESRLDALRRTYHDRQVTLSALALARNLSIVGATAVLVFLVLREWDDSWVALATTTVAASASFMLLQAFSRFLVADDPERWQRLLRPFVALVRLAFRGPVLLLDAPLGIVQRTWQRRDLTASQEAEDLMLLAEVDENGADLEEDERQMIRGVMELEHTPVREVMVPRTDVVAVDASDGFERAAEIMVERGFSRVPVYEGKVDNVVGIAYAKEVMKRLARNEERPELRDVMRAAHFVPESKKVHELLNEMRSRQLSIAIVVDEYGGTAGLVTIEDLLEEIVGEIRDEFDIEEQPVQLLTATEVIVDARVGIDELNEMFDVAVQKGDFDSVGGFIIHELGRIPSVGDQVRVNGIGLKVLSVAGRRIKKVRVTKLTEQDET